MPTYCYVCPACGDETEDFHSMDEDEDENPVVCRQCWDNHFGDFTIMRKVIAPVSRPIVRNGTPRFHR